MSVTALKALALSATLLLSTLTSAMEPLTVISPLDEDYNYYSGVVNMDQKLVNEGLIGVSTEYDMFNVTGRVVAIADGTRVNPYNRLNPYNLVLTVNGNLYYVDSILNRVDSFKIRRRWANNPEPGVFLRIEGRRLNPDDGRSEVATVWIKIATPEGRALPVLKVLEGDYDLADNSAPSLYQPASMMLDQLEKPWPGPYGPYSGEGNPGPLLPPPPMRGENPGDKIGL